MAYAFNTSRQMVEELCHQSGVTLPVRAGEIICKEGLMSYETLITYQPCDWAGIEGCGIKTAKDIMAWVDRLQQLGGISCEEVHQAKLSISGVLRATVVFDRVNRFGNLINRVQVRRPGQSQHNPEYNYESPNAQEAIEHYGLQAQSWVSRLIHE